MSMREFPLDIPAYDRDRFFRSFLIVLEIKDVYQGTEWDDTCIAEIQFIDLEGEGIRYR